MYNSMRNIHRRYYTALGCTFLCMFLLRNFPSLNDSTIQTTTTSRHQAASSDTVVLVPGELPGYTGWARLEHTLAGSFQITSSHAANAVVGKEWNVTVACRECRDDDKHHAHFYARAYGPAVLAGNVVQSTNNNNEYTVRFLFMDPGTYTVELVVISSGAPSWEDFPLVGQEPWYEGFLLPNFPLQLQVVKSRPSHDIQQQRNCTVHDLLSETTTSAYHKARWVVVDKVSHSSHVVVSSNASKQVNLHDYRSGHQSLGIFMDYRYYECSLQSYHDASSMLANYLRTTTDAHQSNVHIIFVGDSVMRMQRALFSSTFPSIKTTWICTSGGMVQVLSNVTSQLQSLANENPNERRLILFNTGLHDISQLCSRVRYDERRVYMTIPDGNYSCTDLYRKNFEKLTNFIHHNPAELRVFQSTTAGWLRYGNYGIEWLLNQTEDLALSSNMVAHFNDIAFDIIHKYENIRVIDGYWVTLARPDNRQIGLVNNRGKHLVHPGEEVLEAMVRNLIHVLQEHFASQNKYGS